VQKQIHLVESGHALTASSQGFGLSAPQRRAVELRAMDIAREWLISRDYRVKDVSSTDPCDYCLTSALMAQIWV